jgi:uncharacterized membrane protein YpjA
MRWIARQTGLVQRLVAAPLVLALLLVIDGIAYFAGLLYWYGPVMANPATPLWAWPFIPDCPLFGLLGGLGLLMGTAQRFWREPGRTRGRRWLWAAAVLAAAAWLSAYLPGAPRWWAGQASMWAVCSWALLAAAIWFRRPPRWLLGIFAFGQIKYGIWTVTAWSLYWRSTTLYFGAPHFSFDSVFMTITHLGLIAQGVFLLTYFRPNGKAVLAALVWFGLSDFMDYGLGFFPFIPQQFISLAFMQWSTILVTWLLAGVYGLLALTGGAPAVDPRPYQLVSTVTRRTQIDPRARTSS